MPPHRWKKGEVANPKGRPRVGTALAETIRERADPHEMFEIAMAIARGEPMVRIVDRQTGRPRLAAAPSRNRDVAPNEERPMPISLMPEDAVIHDITWPSFEVRMTALTWVATMGGMKPPVEIETTIHKDDGQSALDFEKLSPAELDAYVKLVDKASGQKALPEEVIDVKDEEEKDE